MYVVGNLFLWAHFIGIGFAVGCGIALSVTAPKLVTDQREQFWPLFKFFSRMATTGVLILLVSGPLLIWLKFGGTSAFTGWFWAKMNFVGVAIAGAGLHEWARMRFRRGDANAASLMMVGGRLAAFTVWGLVLLKNFSPVPSTLWNSYSRVRFGLPAESRPEL